MVTMSDTLVSKEVLENTLAQAMSRGGEFAEVFVEDRATSSAVLDQRRIEELSSGRDRGAGIRVVVGETTGFAHTADSRKVDFSQPPRRRPPSHAKVAAAYVRSLWVH